MTNIAVLGTGRMGSALAARLLATGHQVTVWNRTRTTSAPAVPAIVADTPAAAVAAAEVVITMLTDGPAVSAVLFDGGAAAALRPGTVLVQMSTISPAETAAIAERLPVGVYFVDAPVGGSVDAAAAGTLALFAGGEPDAVERAEPVLNELGTVRRCGRAGSGSAVKLMQNTAMLTALGGLHDTLALAAGLGVERELALDLLASGPLGTALRRAASTTADFPVALAVKDLRLTHADTPVVAATLRLLRAVPEQSADLAALINLEDR
ncbi:NAD(P)-dependent oxidoreductase [Actinoplanes regularis]|uniref:NAD(P)-dependent oxidoreductase n=1 Tax=Actinoplanes regularis TaxID=52697 RepID=UPI002554C02A|nr:NAD(P)-dependent oxidoreductase [Actinoplanes regularis]